MMLLGFRPHFGLERHRFIFFHYIINISTFMSYPDKIWDLKIKEVKILSSVDLAQAILASPTQRSSEVYVFHLLSNKLFILTITK